MFKPLLRTLPSLTGNIKLACEINDYVDEGNNVYSTYIRSASLQPLQNNLYNRCINVNLVDGMWEYDVAKFYKYYSNYFYKQNFSFLYDDFAKLDLVSYNSNSDSRNKDYEFGCKHISYNNTGYMFDFYAPIFINSVEDLPEYFEIRLDFENGEYKKIRVHINTESNLNYLKVYIEKYLHKINRNVAYFISNTGRMIYYGIDVEKGGLVDIEDTHMSKYLTENTTVNNFDSELCAGFVNNKLIMRQILPLSFHFNIEDIISAYDKLYFIGHKVKISAYYYKNSLQCKFYDFDINYTNKSLIDYSYNAQYQRFITENRLANGSEVYYNVVDNDSIFSLHEKLIKKYYYTNAITPMYGSWKMMFSSDSCPYITNINYAYTNSSNGLYGQFPKLFVKYDTNKYAQLTGTSLTLYCDNIDSNTDDVTKENKKMFRDIQNTYISSWYTLLNKYSINDNEGTNENINNILNNLNNWFKVENNYAYYKGILYNLSNCEHVNDIDYFGVFIKPTYLEINNVSNLYSVTILSDCKELDNGKTQLGDISINEQLHDKLDKLSTDYNKNDYLNDVYDFDNNYIYEDGKIVDKVNGANAKIIDKNLILSKYTKTNLVNENDITDKKLYITVDSVNTKHNNYIKLIDLFNIDFAKIFNGRYIFTSKKEVVFNAITNYFIFATDDKNALGLSYNNTFNYNLLRFSTLMLQKTSLYNSICINNADTFTGFLLNYYDDVQFSREEKINLNTSTNGTKHKWNIFADENGQVYEANVYISKNALISIIQYILSCIKNIYNDEKTKDELVNAIQVIAKQTNPNITEQNVKEVLNEIFIELQENKTAFENMFIDVLDNEVDNYEFVFCDINLRNNLSLAEYYNAINSICLAQSLNQPYDSTINNQWPFTSIDMLLAHINRNTQENSQVNDGLNNALPNIHFVENGYVEKIEKLSISNPLNVDGDGDSTNYSKTLFIDAAYINKYEKHNNEFYAKYYEYLKGVYGEPYRFYDALFDTNLISLNKSDKTIEEIIIDYSNNDENINEFDSLYNVGNYTDNLYKIKGPQYFFNTINRVITYDPLVKLPDFDSMWVTVINKFKYSFDKFKEITTDPVKSIYDKFDKYFPTILTQELTDLVPKFDLSYWRHRGINKGLQHDLETYFTTVLSRIVCKNNLDRLAFEINTGAPITFKEDVLQTNAKYVDNKATVYNSMRTLKNRDGHQFDIKQQFSNKTDSYFYKYNINDNSIYNILTTHAMSERFDFDDIEAMNPTYLSYPLLYDNVMKLFNVTNDDKTSIYLFVGSPFLLLPGITPFENNDRGIFVNYANNTNRVKFGTIPFINKDSKIKFKNYPDINSIFTLLNSETDASKIEQYYDTSTKQINVLFENLCERVIDSNAVNNYDKYNPTKYNSNSNALFMFTDLGLSNNITKTRFDEIHKLSGTTALYVYPNTFICSEFATLQDISSYYSNIEYFNTDDKTQHIGMALISSLKNSYLHNTRNFSEVLRFYKNNDTVINISNIYEYVDKTINNLIDQAYCYDKTWKTLLDTLYNIILDKVKDKKPSKYVNKYVQSIVEFHYLNYIFHELMIISTSYRKVQENILNNNIKKYYDQYPEALQNYIKDGWVCDITLDAENWQTELKTIIYDIIWPLVKSMNIYRQLLETIKLYEVDRRQLNTEAYDNNDMLKFIKIRDGEYYSKIMSVETEEKLSNTATLAIQYANKYSFKAVVSKLYESESNNSDFNYFTKVHEIIRTIIDQCENYLEKDDQIANEYIEFYEDLYSKKELLPLDEHLLENMTSEGYQYYIYELCDESDRQCSTLKYSKDDIDNQLKRNLFTNITNDMISIYNTDKIYYAKLFEYTENNIYKNIADKNMLLSLLNDNHIFSSACNPSSIYGKCVYNTDEPYNVYHYKKDNILFATQLNDTNYSMLSELIKDNLINLFKHIQSNEHYTIYDMIKILSDIIYVILNKFDNNEIHNKLFNESSFTNILCDIVNDINTLIDNSLTPDRTHIDFTQDIYTAIYGKDTELKLNYNCSLLTNKLSEWYNEYWKENIPIIDTSFENIILDTNKNNRSLTNISQDLENFRQAICNEDNTINAFKIFKHISINICKNLPYKDSIIQIIEYISNIYNGKDKYEQIIAFCNDIISNIDNENEQIRTESHHILSQLLNYFIIYHDMTLYAYAMNNAVSFGKLCDNISYEDNVIDVIDNIDNNLHIIERTNNDGTVTKYAYYCLDLNITNSSLHYNIDSISRNMVMTFDSINNKYIESNKMMFIDKYFNLLYPLLKVDILLYMLQQSKVVQKPYQFQQRIVLNALKNNVEDFQTCYYKYDNGERYIKELERSYNLYKVNNARNTQVITLNRYLNYIEPILKETDVVRDFKSRMFKTNNTIYSGQNLFTENINIKKYNPIIAFNKLEQYNTISLVDNKSLKYYIYPNMTIKQYEYKHFNDNNLYMLENSFEYENNKLYTYDELLKAEDNTTVYNLFKNYIRKRHNNLTIDENEILFLFNKYNVTFKSNFSKLDLALSNKLYTLKYIFSLK